MESQEPSKETKDGWHNDPSNWIWGMFYHNRNDKRLFVPKRIPMMGMTLNFANPISVISFIGILAIPLIIAIL